MELYSKESFVSMFMTEYSHKHDYILTGEYYANSSFGGRICILVDYSIGATCYVKAYILGRMGMEIEFDSIVFESVHLDSILRYRYLLLDRIRDNHNLLAKPEQVYSLDVQQNNNQYTFEYYIGYDEKAGLLEDLGRQGRLRIALFEKSIVECFRLTTLIRRFIMFMYKIQDISINRILLELHGLPSCEFILRDNNHGIGYFNDAIFCKFEPERYCERIINNLALDPDEVITHSIPLGHLKSSGIFVSPTRFINQVLSFEYLFEKLHHNKAKTRLVDKLRQKLYEYPEVMINPYNCIDEDSENIKEIRRKITHGYEYYYNFNNNRKIQILSYELDDLIRCMSLELIGFCKDDILDFLKFHI